MPRRDESLPEAALAVTRAIRGALRRAGAALAFEQVWPRLLPAGMVVGVFLTVSWLGLWLVLPAVARIGLLALFAVALAASLWQFRGISLPGRLDARQRVEEQSDLSHRPITALEDSLGAASASDAATRRLWEAHRQRAAAQVGRLSSGLPAPRMAARDPYALRAALLLLLIVSFTWAGPDWPGRIASAFAPVERAGAEQIRIDAWVSPPDYTGQPPLLLTGRADSESMESADATSRRAIEVPQGAMLVVRGPGGGDMEVSADTGPAIAADDDATAENGNSQSTGAGADPSRLTEVRVELAESGRVAVDAANGPRLDWTFDVIPDEPPTIAFASEPTRTVSRALELSYELTDDYGVVGAQARFEPLDEDLAAIEDPLIAPPDFSLTLPRMRARSGSAQTIRDLTSHPWAGAPVRLQLVAEDDLGQEGTSETVEFALPERQFREPLARALVEQRRALAVDRDAREQVAVALDALARAQEGELDDLGVYLGMRSTYWRLRYAHEDEALRSVVDQLWEIALKIEDGELSLAAEDLRAAQERLAEALEGDASEEEIRELMDELRAALDRYMEEMARRAMEDPDTALSPDQDMRELSPDELSDMLDSIEDLARTGAREEARDMLSQLRQMLENLQAGTPEGMESGPMGEMLDELGDMIRQQQELMDQTFRFDQDGQGQGQQDQLGELGEGQGALRDALEALMDQLAELGMEPGSELGQAGEAMGEAEGALGEGDTGQALGQQGRALENLRQGGQELAEQMMGQGQAQGQDGGRTDPFGRPLRNQGPDYGESVDVPDQLDAQRARQILEELRRRSSEQERPRLELDYLDRLLEQF